MRRAAKRARKGVQKHVVQEAKKAHLGKKIGRELKTMARDSIQTAIAQGISGGMGAYGRGAYGRGSYAVGPQAPKVNSLFTEYDRRRHETFSEGDETGRTTISRREYVMRVTAPNSTSFENTSFAINPGLSGVFAWLSQIAANYDEYELQHLVFHYKPVISQASQTGTMGSILLAANYNAGAPKFASFREMAEYSGSLETRICDEALFGVECDPSKHSSQPIEFIRSGSVPLGQDIKTYDLASFQLATSDVDSVSFPAGTLLGHLYVEYQVRLGKPKLFTALGKNIRQDMYRGTVGVTSADAFGTEPIANSANNLGTTLSSTNTILLPDNFYGRLCVTYYIQDDTVDIDPFTVAGNIDITIIQGPNGQANSDRCSGTLSAVHGAMVQMFAQVSPATNNVTNSFTVNISNVSNVSRGFTLDVVQCNPDFVDWN